MRYAQSLWLLSLYCNFAWCWRLSGMHKFFLAGHKSTQDNAWDTDLNWQEEKKKKAARAKKEQDDIEKSRKERDTLINKQVILFHLSKSISHCRNSIENRDFRMIFWETTPFPQETCANPPQNLQNTLLSLHQQDSWCVSLLKALHQTYTQCPQSSFVPSVSSKFSVCEI